MAVNSTQGTLLKVTIATVLTTVAQRVSIKPNEVSHNEIETTDLDATAETSIAGIERGGELDLTVNWDMSLATHAFLEASRVAKTILVWNLILTDTGACTDAFSAWIKSRKIGDAEVDKKQEANFKLKVTGASTLTA